MSDFIDLEAFVDERAIRELDAGKRPVVHLCMDYEHAWRMNVEKGHKPTVLKVRVLLIKEHGNANTK